MSGGRRAQRSWSGTWSLWGSCPRIFRCLKRVHSSAPAGMKSAA